MELLLSRFHCNVVSVWVGGEGGHHNLCKEMVCSKGTEKPLPRLHLLECMYTAALQEHGSTLL